eukprot:1161224-Pelagomonas_calceolata.AAC.8
MKLSCRAGERRIGRGAPLCGSDQPQPQGKEPWGGHQASGTQQQLQEAASPAMTHEMLPLERRPHKNAASSQANKDRVT